MTPSSANSFRAGFAGPSGPASEQSPAPVGDNTISRLANETHRLRLENERLRDAINTITCALEALKS